MRLLNRHYFGHCTGKHPAELHTYLFPYLDAHGESPLFKSIREQVPKMGSKIHIIDEKGENRLQHIMFRDRFNLRRRAAVFMGIGPHDEDMMYQWDKELPALEELKDCIDDYEARWYMDHFLPQESDNTQAHSIEQGLVSCIMLYKDKAVRALETNILGEEQYRKHSSPRVSEERVKEALYHTSIARHEPTDESRFLLMLNCLDHPSQNIQAAAAEGLVRMDAPRALIVLQTRYEEARLLLSTKVSEASEYLFSYEPGKMHNKETAAKDIVQMKTLLDQYKVDAQNIERVIALLKK